ncbi:hypothetical protein [Solobacterium moorei]|uniref:Lipoprotein n=1 Tax=Solobacterium moorei F0204 TaxID=706433 RepID=E7MQ18_9FIRM|nr:hypothetical protein [Solobacterium moorei]EFW23738.1 hypothetical protein HMPREF9430_01543 [Solobacterium moorei F0204]
MKIICSIIIIICTALLAGCTGSGVNYSKKEFYTTAAGFDTGIYYIEWVNDTDTSGDYKEHAETTFDRFAVYNKLFDSFKNWLN